MKVGYALIPVHRDLEFCACLENTSFTSQGLVNVPIEHHPTIGDTISNGYLKVMFKILKKGHLPTPASPLIH